MHIKSLTSTIHANTAKQNDWSLRHNSFADFSKSKIALHNAMWNCSIIVTLKFKTSTKRQKQQQQQKHCVFTKASCCNVQTQLKPKWDFTRKPPPIKNILFKICCQKSTHTENKEPPKLVCSFVTVGKPVYLLLWDP